MNYIIFDMDGVLIDSEPIYRKRQKEFLELKGFHNVPEELYDKICGANSRDSYQLWKEHLPGFQMSYETYMKERREALKGQTFDVRKIVDSEIYELLEFLRQENYHVALASSSFKDTIYQNLDKLKIRSCFELVVSGMDFRRSKPDPEIYCYTMQKLGVEPQKCLVVEDSTYGITAAKDAGAIVIGKIDQRFGYDQSRADFLVKHLLEIKDICRMLKM